MFVSERLAPLSVAGYQRMVARAGMAARFPFLISSHVLRHSCGYKLANGGHDTRAIQHFLGHRSIASTAPHTAKLNGSCAARVRLTSTSGAKADIAGCLKRARRRPEQVQ